MKKLLYKFIILSAFATILTACDGLLSLSNSNKKSAQGAPYELLVVCNAPQWEGSVGEALRAVLEQPVEMINQYEPLFTVLRITASDFKNMLPAHRNILKVVVSPTLTSTQIVAQYNVESAPQIVLTFQGPSDKALCEYLAENGASLVQVLEKAERDRTIAFGTKHNVKSLSDLMTKKFGITFPVPKGYELRSESEDFVWASYEFPTSSQGFFIYSYPYQGKGSMTSADLVRMRNYFAARIPGPSKGSYMTTVDKVPDAEAMEYIPFEPDCRTIKIGERIWIEVRGLWEVENDFMGGPFVSYSTFDKSTNRIVTLDCYVYSPKYGKRNYLRALEHLVYMIEFPED